jgi:hypothetical protein
MTPQSDPNVFHQHLEECERCRNHPFNLCKEGIKKLEEEAKSLSIAKTKEEAEQ